MYYAIYIFTFFALVGFFNYHQMLSDQLIKLIFYCVTIVAFALAITDRRINIDKTGYPKTAYNTLMAMLILSPVMAGIFHGQPLIDSIVTALSIILAYLWFYILMKFEISEEKIIRVILIGCAIAVPVYFLNLRAFPGAMFGEQPVEQVRGILRLPVVFIELFPLVLFYAINRWLISKRPIWIAVIAVCIVMIVISVIRQIIVVSALMAIIFLFRSLNWKQRALVLVPLLVVAIVIVPRLMVFQALNEVTEAQQEFNERNDQSDIRIQAWKFYTYEYHPNIATMILGNGYPAIDKTQYGIRYGADTEAAKCYEADVGWAGFFFFFGAIATVALFIFMWKAMVRRQPPDRQYIKYWIAFIIITSVASGPILYTYQIFNVVTVLYLAYAPVQSIHGTDNPQLQQR